MSEDEGKIDHTFPYYLDSGDQPGNLITHVILTGDNYIAWSRAITLALKSRAEIRVCWRNDRQADWKEKASWLGHGELHACLMDIA